MRNKLLNLALKFIGITFLVLTLMSCRWTNKLDVYTCVPSYAAESCGGGCTIEKDFKYSFVTNKEDKSVLHVSYLEGAQAAVTHKNCTIFNNENWDCSELDTLPYTIIKRRLIMANGIFTHTNEIRDLANGNLRNPNEKGTCAK